MNSTITMASSAYADELEQVCKSFGEYKKEYRNGVSYFEMNNVDWDEEHSQYSRDVSEFLSRFSEDSYAFIRVGNRLNDIQINGNPNKFDINVTLEVSY